MFVRWGFWTLTLLSLLCSVVTLTPPSSSTEHSFTKNIFSSFINAMVNTCLYEKAFRINVLWACVGNRPDSTSLLDWCQSLIFQWIILWRDRNQISFIIILTSGSKAEAWRQLTRISSDPTRRPHRANAFWSFWSPESALRNIQWGSVTEACLWCPVPCVRREDFPSSLQL